MIALDEILEDLELPAAAPGPGYLERLFLRFNGRVPFESASKILRSRRIASLAERPRVPEVFWSERLESGTGGTCFARVAAFDALLKALGFSTRLALGRVREDFDHAALLASIGEGEWICDVGFPLPVLLPARAGQTESALATYDVAPTALGFRIAREGGVPDGPRQIEIFTAPVSEEEYRSRWEASFRPESKFLAEVVLQRFFENRRVVFVRGALRVEDRHSRTTLPLSSPRTPALSELFGLDEAVLAEAFQAAGDPDAERADALVEVYLESPVAADHAFSAIASPEGYSALLAGVADVSTRPAGPGAFTATISPPGETAASASIEESVEISPARLALSVRRSGRESAWVVEERDGQTWLIRRATLDGPRLDLLRNDSLRGRLAGSLAVDLLAWARMLRSRES